MKWIKKGLIFEPQGSLEWMSTHAAVPLADNIDGDIYRIYFSGRDQLNRSQTGFVEIDIKRPQEILRFSAQPVLTLGVPGNFDDSGAMGSWIVTHHGKKYFYYIGWNLGKNIPFRNAIGLAICENEGCDFKNVASGPIMDRSIYDPCFVASSCVLMEEDIWKMWYLSCIHWRMDAEVPKHYYHIKYAESRDGINWERHGVVCIDFASASEYAISRPSVVKDDGLYKMWYSYRGESYRIGYAESNDGLHWKRKDEEVGIDVSEAGWDSEMIEYPFVFDHKGERYMLYNGNGYGESGIGLAVLDKNS